MFGTVCTILAVQMRAPCSPCMNCEKRQASMWRRTSPFSASLIFSHHGVPLMGTASSGMPVGLVGSTSVDQSMRSLPIHCRRVPLS